MSEQNTGTLDALIQQKIEGDTQFQESLKDLPDDEKNTLIESRKVELLKTEAPTWFDKATKNETLANNYKTRAEKAEGDLKKFGGKKDEDGQNMSYKDLLALNESKVPTEDAEDVIEYAKFKNISISEALKSGVVKATLSEKAELRRTAAATTTRSTRQTTKVDADSIINDMKSKGESAVPEPGSSEAEEIFWKRRGGRRG